MLQDCVAGTKSQSWHTCEKVAWACFWDMLQRDILSCVQALFHSRNMKFVQNLPLQHVARSSTSPSTRGCVAAGNMSPKHDPATFSQVCQLCDLVPATQPCNMSRQCVLNTILSQLHFAATCSCNMSPRVGPPLCSTATYSG